MVQVKVYNSIVDDVDSVNIPLDALPENSQTKDMAAAATEKQDEEGSMVETPTPPSPNTSPN